MGRASSKITASSVVINRSQFDAEALMEISANGPLAISRLAPTLGDPTTSWRYSLTDRSRATLHSVGGGLDPSLTLRVGMVTANQSIPPSQPDA